jgi:hypothetical protein
LISLSPLTTAHPSCFQPTLVRASTECYLSFTLAMVRSPRFACTTTDLIALFRLAFATLTGVLFTFPSRYLFTIGRRGVFSLGSWSTQIPTGFHVSRGTRKRCKEVTEPFAYGAFTLFGSSFQKPSARLVICNFPDWPQPIQTTPHNPVQATPAGLALARFGLFRVRSPLLTESLLFSLPGGTEMVHFPPFASTDL